MQKIVSLGIISLILFSPLAVACTSEARAREVLDEQGFTDVEMTGYVWAACSDDDVTHTGFRATNPKGRKVEGVVCCGWLKSCTVRW